MGVCTVVTKLFNICRPDRAYFGEKDAQQLAVIKKMVRELDIPVRIVPCPTVREPDGLALGSRNVRLSPEERAQAPVLHRALSAALTLVENGERDVRRLKDEICALVAEADLAKIDYVEIVDTDDLASLRRRRRYLPDRACGLVRRDEADRQHHRGPQPTGDEPEVAIAPVTGAALEERRGPTEHGHSGSSARPCAFPGCSRRTCR